MLPISLFRKAGATGHVFLLGSLFSSGQAVDKGLAYSGFIGPMTTVAVVPTTPQIINFEIEARTVDKQGVIVTGSLTATLVPATAVSKFDFTVNPKDGNYVSPWQQVLNAKVIERVLRAVLGKVKGLEVENATWSQREVEEAIIVALGASQNSLSGDGITVSSCSIPNIEPADEEVAGAIGSKERQEMITESDDAIHARRLNAVENERAVKKYEAETALRLEEERTALIAKQGENEKKKAEGDAEATKIRLAPLEDVEAGKLIGAAIMDAAKTGRLGSLAITSEFLAAVGQK